MQDTKKQGGDATPSPSPSQVHASPSGQVLAAYRINAIKERAAALFAEKPYSVRHRPAYLGAAFGSYGAQAIGALLAFTAVRAWAVEISPIWPEIVGALAAGLLLFGIEYAKRVLGGSLVTSYLRSAAVKSHERVNVGAGLLLACLVSVSVASSWRGAEMLAVQQADRSKAISAAYEAKNDSVRQRYAAAVGREEAALQGFRKAISWKGHIDTRHAETRQVIAAHMDEIAALKESLRNELHLLEARRRNALELNAADTANKAWITALASLGFELLALVCIRFAYVYLHRVYVAEAAGEGWLETNEKRSENGSASQLDDLLSSWASSRKATPFAAVSNASVSGEPSNAFRQAPIIGFEVAETQKQKAASPPAPKGADLGNGNRSCKRCGTSFVYRVWHHVYCSDRCRLQAWEERKGRRSSKKGEGREVA